MLCLPGVLSFNCRRGGGEKERRGHVLFQCVHERVSRVFKPVCVCVCVTVFVSAGGNLDLV